MGEGFDRPKSVLNSVHRLRPSFIHNLPKDKIFIRPSMPGSKLENTDTISRVACGLVPDTDGKTHDAVKYNCTVSQHGPVIGRRRYVDKPPNRVAIESIAFMKL